MTAEERAYLEQQFANLPPQMTLSKNALGDWGFMTLSIAGSFILIGLLIAALIKLIDWLIGTDIAAIVLEDTRTLSLILLAGLILAAILAAKYTVIAQRFTSDMAANYQQDLADNVVDASTHQITDVKLFREPEHGGLMFFLRTDADKTLFLFDVESQDMALETGDDTPPPMITPKRTLTLTFFPNTHLTYEGFEGAPLPLPDILDMTADPADWPEDRSWIDTPWDKLEKTFST